VIQEIKGREGRKEPQDHHPLIMEESYTQDGGRQHVLILEPN
jgi:hypothetical protein